MIEQMKRAALLSVASALFASGVAWGQQPPNWQADGRRLLIPMEYFGEPREVLLGERLRTDARAPFFKLSSVDFGNDQYVAQGNIAVLTFTLRGATFGASVSPGDLAVERFVRQFGGSNPSSTRVALNSSVSPAGGGAVGDNSVSFRVTVGADCLLGKTVTGLSYNRAIGANDGGLPSMDDWTLCSRSTPANGTDGWVTNAGATTTVKDEFTLTPRSLVVDPVTFATPAGVTRMPATQGVAMVASIELVESVSAGGLAFPTIVAGSVDHDGDADTVGRFDLGFPNGRDGLLIQVQPILTVTANDGTDAQVDIRTRNVLAATGGSVSMKVGTNNVRALKVATLMIDSVAPDATPGNNSFYELRVHEQATTDDGPKSSLGGNVDVTVAGPFRDGDEVYLGDTKMTMNDDGDFVGSTTIENTDAGGMLVNYVPNGEDDLRPGDFTAMAALDFNDSKNNSGDIALSRTGDPDGMGMASIAYQGVGVKSYAYGIVRAGGAGMSFLRVGCVTSAPGCAVFLDCTDQAGATYFGELSPMGPGATTVYDSDDVAAAFSTGGWETGRGSCQLLSNGALEVQHNVRSGGIQTGQNDVIGTLMGTNDVGPLAK